MSSDSRDGHFVLLDRRRGLPAPIPSASIPVAGFLSCDLSDTALRAPPPPSFDLSEMERARQESFDLGRAAGLAEADTTLLADRTRTLAIIASLMSDADARVSDVADRAAEVLSEALLGALRAMMPNLVARSALGEAGAMLAAVLSGLSREPVVRVAVPSAIAEGVRVSVSSLPEYRGRIEVEVSDSMEAGAVSVAWATGQASRTPAQVWDQVMNAIAPLLGGSAAEDATNV